MSTIYSLQITKDSITPLDPHFHVGKNPPVDGGVIRKIEQVISHRFDLVPPDDLPAKEKKRRIFLRHQAKGFVYQKPAWAKTATIVKNSYGSLRKGAYEFPTREVLMHIGKALAFLFPRLKGEWFLVEFPEATDNPPAKIVVTK